nr:sulfatase-like hydrolase/transferase [Haloferula rosea]
MERIRAHAWMVCLVLSLAFIVKSPAADSKPNIILLYIDDWAWNGSPVPMDDGMENSRMPVLRMPNVERLAREGMKFRNAYGSPQCSPARVCVQTGQSSPRSGFTVFMNDKGQDYFDAQSFKGFPVVGCVSDMTIDPGTATIPEVLKPLGYVSAHIGKWHMRGDPGGEGYVVHDGDTSNTPGNTVSGAGKQRLPDDLTDPKLMFSVTEKAIGFIEDQVKAGTPFYLQISHYAMHEGRECLPATREKYTRHPAVQAYYKKKGVTADTVKRKDDPAIWLGMGEDLDGRIGAVLDRIRDLGIEDNTYVVLAADNGYRHSFLPGLTQPLHATKWWVWDGGIRVPMIARGPGIMPGSMFPGNVVNYDFLPTFFEWAGGKPGDLEDVDGISLAGFLAGEKPSAGFLNRRLYFHYPHYRTTVPHSAVVSGSHKVLHFYERPDFPMLFDLSEDPGEVYNIALKRPAIHQQLHDDLMAYLGEVDARLPKLNPEHDPAAYRKDPDYEKRSRWGPFTGRRALDADEKKEDLE